MDGSESEAVVASMQRLRSTFDWTYPVVGILALAYIGTSDLVFAIFGVVGNRLPRTVRSLMRKAYCAVQVLAAATLHLSMIRACYTTETCTDKPLHRRWCMAVASVSIVAYVFVLVADRGMDPLLKVAPRYPGHERGMMARVFNAAAVCAGWICLAEGETMGVVLLLAATARRALAPAPLVAKLYLGLLKTYTLTHTFWVLHNPTTCRCTSRRAPVAVMGTILGL